MLFSFSFLVALLNGDISQLQDTHIISDVSKENSTKSSDLLNSMVVDDVLMPVASKSQQGKIFL